MDDMDRRRSMPPQARRSSRRLTTVESWRELGYGVGSLPRASVQMITIEPQFDLERWHDDNVSTRSPMPDIGKYQGSRVRTSSLASEELANALGPFDDVFALEESDLAEEKSDQVYDLNTLKSANVPPGQKAGEEKPYHVFSHRQKWFLIITIGVAGMFSGLSSNIYFPALNTIARDLHVSLNDVSLTITSYLIIQGIAPVIWGSLSDALGRRPIYLASFTVYIIANIALSFSPNFALLLLFRGLQAAGSASTVSIGNGVIQDVSPPAERGAFISFYQAIRNFSIAVGPVLGGLLAQFLGFRSIFVFLLILSSLTIVVIFVFLPETMRSIAGDGSLRLRGIYKPIAYSIRAPEHARNPPGPVCSKRVTLLTFVEPLRLLVQKDILFNLVFGGVVYSIWSMVTSSTPGLFNRSFALSEILLGLAFLPNGFGTIVGSTIAGKLMTHDFATAESAYKAAHGLQPDYKLPAKDLPADFPIEHARLRHLPWIGALFAVATAAYGFSLASPTLAALRGWIAVPLTLQFLIAATSNAVFALNQTLVSDLCPGRGASSTAINNLVRCGLGAVGVAFIETMIAAVGPGPAFFGLALIVVICVPLVAATWFRGVKWRARRMERRAGPAGSAGEG